MRLFTVVIFLLLPLPIGAESGQDPAEILLSWVESASPDEYFQRDSSAGKYKFYWLQGYAGEMPEVDNLNCYSGVVETVLIKGTSGHLKTERHVTWPGKFGPG